MKCTLMVVLRDRSGIDGLDPGHAILKHTPTAGIVDQRCGFRADSLRACLETLTISVIRLTFSVGGAAVPSRGRTGYENEGKDR